MWWLGARDGASEYLRPCWSISGSFRVIRMIRVHAFLSWRELDLHTTFRADNLSPEGVI
jgi:hypothetical protein